MKLKKHMIVIENRSNAIKSIYTLFDIILKKVYDSFYHFYEFEENN